MFTQNSIVEKCIFSFVVVTLIMFMSAVLYRYQSSYTRSKQRQHVYERLLINKNIRLFHDLTESWPTAMTKQSSTHPPLTHDYFFPASLPTACTFGTPWIIDSKTHLLVAHKHEKEIRE